MESGDQGSELKVVAQAPRRCHASHSESCRASCSESGRASHSESGRASCSEVPLFCKHFRALRLRALWAVGPRIDSTPPNSDFTEWSAGTLPRESGKCVAAILATLKIRFFILPARRPRLLLASLAAASTPRRAWQLARFRFNILMPPCLDVRHGSYLPALPLPAGHSWQARRGKPGSWQEASFSSCQVRAGKSAASALVAAAERLQSRRGASDPRQSWQVARRAAANLPRSPARKAGKTTRGQLATCQPCRCRAPAEPERSIR